MLVGEDERALTKAAEAVLTLLRDADIVRRCRQVAERIYSLGADVAGYYEIYR